MKVRLVQNAKGGVILIYSLQNLSTTALFLLVSGKAKVYDAGEPMRIYPNPQRLSLIKIRFR
jgi:hypothetical protein